MPPPAGLPGGGAPSSLRTSRTYPFETYATSRWFASVRTGHGRGPNRLPNVNRAPRWLLPTVLTALILAVLVGAVLR